MRRGKHDGALQPVPLGDLDVPREGAGMVEERVRTVENVAIDIMVALAEAAATEGETAITREEAAHAVASPGQIGKNLKRSISFLVPIINRIREEAAESEARAQKLGADIVRQVRS
jgi:hypothetical protein